MSDDARPREEGQKKRCGNVWEGKVWEDPLSLYESGHTEVDDWDVEEEEAGGEESCDAENYDEDGTPLGEGADDEEDCQYFGHGRDDTRADDADLDRARIDEIHVINHGGEYVCEYRPLPWQVGNGGRAFEKRILFLRACATWLQKHKQKFLCTQKTEDYLDGEYFLQQKDFIECINAEAGLTISKDNFSRVLPSVHLIWEDGISLPLKVLFGEDIRKCLEQLNKSTKK